jgi:hypothetical protein
MLTDKENILLRRALDPASSPAEAAKAAEAFVTSLRKRGLNGYDFVPPPPPRNQRASQEPPRQQAPPPKQEPKPQPKSWIAKAKETVTHALQLGFVVFLLWACREGWESFQRGYNNHKTRTSLEAEKSKEAVRALSAQPTPTPIPALGTKDNPIWESDLTLDQLYAIPEGTYVQDGGGYLYVKGANGKMYLGDPEPKPTPTFKLITGADRGVDGKLHNGLLRTHLGRYGKPTPSAGYHTIVTT